MPDSNALGGHFNAVFISPHLDDAVLSCGGTIAQLAASGRVLVLNVFTHYPSSYRKGAINAGEQRYDEEREAARCLGYQSVNLGETDAIFRETTRGSAGRLFRAPATADIAGIGALRARITGCLDGIEYDRLYIPMGIGWHVDHLLCHLATRPLLDQPNVFLYEDAPYCLIPNATRYRVHELGIPPATAALAAPTVAGLTGDWRTTRRWYLSTPPVAGITSYPVRAAANVVVGGYLGWLMARHIRRSGTKDVPLGAWINDISATFDRKISACYLYASQIGGFFFDRNDCIRQFTRYSETLGSPPHRYERFWQLKAATER
jgi:LmbE family N-acetylglucosaminyl deacetylase